MGTGPNLDSGLNTGVTAPAPPTTPGGMFEAAKQYGWTFLGSMWMERKNGGWGVSLHRILGTILFGVCLWLWLSGYEVPDGLVYTLWGLLGINGAKSLATQGIQALKIPDSGMKKVNK